MKNIRILLIQKLNPLNPSFNNFLRRYQSRIWRFGTSMWRESPGFCCRFKRRLCCSGYLSFWIWGISEIKFHQIPTKKISNQTTLMLLKTYLRLWRPKSVIKCSFVPTKSEVFEQENEKVKLFFWLSKSNTVSSIMKHLKTYLMN